MHCWQFVCCWQLNISASFSTQWRKFQTKNTKNFELLGIFTKLSLSSRRHRRQAEAGERSYVSTPIPCHTMRLLVEYLSANKYQLKFSFSANIVRESAHEYATYSENQVTHSSKKIRNNHSWKNASPISHDIINRVSKIYKNSYASVTWITNKYFTLAVSKSILIWRKWSQLIDAWAPGCQIWQFYLFPVLPRNSAT